MIFLPFSLAGRLVVVTGGASGIGVGIAEMLAEAGALVVIADRQAGAARAQAEALVAAGGAADWVEIDVTSEASVAAGAAEVVRRHGAPWAVVNNAGMQDRQFILDESVDGWDLTQTVNARGPFLVTREFAQAMIAAMGEAAIGPGGAGAWPGGAQGGRIVNIASGALSGMILRGSGAYAASKGALVAFASISALEFAPHGITVNTVLPGGVASPGAIAAKGPAPEGPGRRPQPFGLCDPRDIGAAVLYLCSPAAGRVTNQVLAVDGGFSLS